MSQDRTASYKVRLTVTWSTHPPWTVIPFLLSCFHVVPLFHFCSTLYDIRQTPPARLFRWRCGGYANHQGTGTALYPNLGYNYSCKFIRPLLKKSRRLRWIRRTVSLSWLMFDTQERPLLTWPATSPWCLVDSYVSTGPRGFSSYSKNALKTNGSIGVWLSALSQCCASCSQHYRKFRLLAEKEILCNVSKNLARYL